MVDRAVAASGADAISTEDLVATLTELTARTVVEAVSDAPHGSAPAALVCSGGGALNPTLLGRIGALAGERGIAVESSAARGVDPAFKESLMFALLGYCSWHGVPIALTAPVPARTPRACSADSPRATRHSNFPRRFAAWHPSPSIRTTPGGAP